MFRNSYYNSRFARCLPRQLLFACFIFGCTQSLAQTGGSVKGSLLDSLTSKPLPLATVTVFTASDTSIVAYRLSNPDGVFKVPGLPLELPLRMIISYAGYKVVRKEFTLAREQPALDLGAILIHTDTASLDEVLVLAERPPIVYRKDTIEFNASAFKTLPAALVEDLLKKLPGVTVNLNGTIAVNGRSVNRILVDGKEFFGNDITIATRNLPANVIDKVQVVDDEEEKLRNPNATAMELGKVINLKLKKHIKQGWFGKLYAGAGTKDRYEGGGIINLFRDTLQVSLLGYGNNVNRAAFSARDIISLGGFNRSFFRNLNIDDGALNVDGLSFGGSNRGIERSNGTGLNVNHELSKKTTLNLQYFYGYINNQATESINTQQFVRDTVLISRQNNRQLKESFAHQAGGSIKHKFSTTSSILLRPIFSFNTAPVDLLSNTRTISNVKSPLNENTNAQQVRNNQFNYSHELLYNNYKFRKPGRVLNVTNTVAIGNRRSDQYNDAVSIFYQFTEDTSVLAQLRNVDVNSVAISVTANYVHPVSKKSTLRVSAVTDFYHDAYNVNTFAKRGNEYDSLLEDFSNKLRSDVFKNVTSFIWDARVKKDLLISSGITSQYLSVLYRDRQARQDKVFHYLWPYFELRWKTNMFAYRARITEPDPVDVLPVVNNTNPLYQFIGNLDLKPAVAHNFSVLSSKIRPQKFFSSTLQLQGTLYQDAVIREKNISATGVQFSRPLNTNGLWNVSALWSVNKRYKLAGNRQLSLTGLMRGGVGNNIILLNGSQSDPLVYNVNPTVEYLLSFGDRIDLNQRYILNWYTMNAAANTGGDLSYTTHNLLTEIVVRIPKNVVWETRLDYQRASAVYVGNRRSAVLWNAGVSYIFLKDDKGILKLQMFDILNQNTGIYRLIRENFIQDTQVNLLNQYLLLTFTYNIRYFGPKKIGGRNSLFLF
jgi:hypothetical protein